MFLEEFDLRRGEIGGLKRVRLNSFEQNERAIGPGEQGGQRFAASAHKRETKCGVADLAEKGKRLRNFGELLFRADERKELPKEVLSGRGVAKSRLGRQTGEHDAGPVGEGTERSSLDPGTLEV